MIITSFCRGFHTISRFIGQSGIKPTNVAFASHFLIFLWLPNMMLRTLSFALCGKWYHYFWRCAECLDVVCLVSATFFEPPPFSGTCEYKAYNQIVSFSQSATVYLPFPHGAQYMFLRFFGANLSDNGSLADNTNNQTRTTKTCGIVCGLCFPVIPLDGVWVSSSTVSFRYDKVSSKACTTIAPGGPSTLPQYEIQWLAFCK